MKKAQFKLIKISIKSASLSRHFIFRGIQATKILWYDLACSLDIEVTLLSGKNGPKRQPAAEGKACSILSQHGRSGHGIHHSALPIP
jgi:hypothetical protein